MAFVNKKVLTEKIGHAFRLLNKLGYVTRIRFNESFWYSRRPIPEGTSKYACYDLQGAMTIREYGHCAIMWEGSGYELVEVLKAAGLVVNWNESSEYAISVRLPDDDNF